MKFFETNFRNEIRNPLSKTSAINSDDSKEVISAKILPLMPIATAVLVTEPKAEGPAGGPLNVAEILRSIQIPPELRLKPEEAAKYQMEQLRIKVRTHNNKLSLHLSRGRGFLRDLGTT